MHVSLFFVSKRKERKRTRLFLESRQKPYLEAVLDSHGAWLVDESCQPERGAVVNQLESKLELKLAKVANTYRVSERY